MLPSHHWAREFKVEAADVEFLVNLLLEKETPLTSQQLAHVLIENRLQTELAALEDRFKDALPYDPSQTYQTGQKLVFPNMNYAIAQVTDIRAGTNPDYGEFNVIRVVFEGQDDKPREFATELTAPHQLSQDDNGTSLLQGEAISAETIIDEAGDEIVTRLEAHLMAHDDLVFIARRWFPRDLMLEVDDGHLNLAEAVLDINSGGPLTTENILEEIGGLGSSPLSLQVFSLNYSLNADARFDEVGPAGEVLWYLARMAPEAVQNTPEILRFTPFDYDRGILDEEMLQLEAEIGDEHSPLETADKQESATVTLIYPHLRAGTLPLNARVETFFPTARSANRIYITLIDGQDEETYTGWVVPSARYVYGLGDIYRKHQLPIGAYVTISHGEQAGQIRVDVNAYRPRSEWVGLTRPQGENLRFENSKRAIGADYDDLMLLGVDDLAALDQFVNNAQNKKKPLAAILRMLVPNLGKLTPQAATHVKTLYSATNMLRRCPPGPILATLAANPDFENVGGHYWKLVDD